VLGATEGWCYGGGATGDREDGYGRPTMATKGGWLRRDGVLQGRAYGGMGYTGAEVYGTNWLWGAATGGRLVARIDAVF